MHKIRLQGDFFETWSKWPKWQEISVDIKILSPGVVCPWPVAIYIYSIIKRCVWSQMLKRFFFILQKMTIVMRPSCWHKNFGPNGLSAPGQGLCTCIKSWKNVHKIRVQSYILKHATSNQSDKTFLLAKGCLFLPWGFLYMYEIKQISYLFGTGTKWWE